MTLRQLLLFASSSLIMSSSVLAQGDPRPVRLITLDPGHFHAALVQKFMYPQVDPLVHIYAPNRDDLPGHLQRIESFNKRSEQPTHWRQEIYTGTDYLDRMLAEKAGNVVVISGNNARKTDYILRSVQSGLNVLADKPMVIAPRDLDRLREAFTLAQKKGVLLYDIMTERFEITSILQRELAQQTALFGELQRGSVNEPAITKQSVHHFSKVVAGAALQRPPWFFDVRQQGEGIVDVTTHLVDLVQWQAFPEQSLTPADANVLTAKRWSTPLTGEQFTEVTGLKQFPDYLKGDVRDGVLHVFANGEFTYRLRGVHARISVAWNFKAPPGGSDTHFSTMRGTKADLIIRQGEAQQFKPVLYIENAVGGEPAVQAAIAALQSKYPGIGVRKEGEAWRVTVPATYDVGHEAHFAQVTENFLRYLNARKLPDWEVPNMLTKYATIMQAYERSRQE
jgi:predicted dehydrogenase